VYDSAAGVTGVIFHLEGDHPGGHSSASHTGSKSSNGWWYLEWEYIPRRGHSEPEGTYTLTAEAIRDDGTSIVSPAVTFTIEAATSTVRR